MTPDDTDPNASPTGGLTQGDYGLEPNERLLTPLRILFLVGAAAFAAFWFWALFLIDKTPFNWIDDRAWAERAEEICAPVEQEIRVLSLERSDDLEVRAGLVDESTGLLDDMLADIMMPPPDDARSVDLVRQWLDDYDNLIERRYAYADELRAGIDEPFTEPRANGESIPATEKLEAFAGDNRMPSCGPPRAGALNLRG